MPPHAMAAGNNFSSGSAHIDVPPRSVAALKRCNSLEQVVLFAKNSFFHRVANTILDLEFGIAHYYSIVIRSSIILQYCLIVCAMAAFSM
jgi:hypothetical protein